MSQESLYHISSFATWSVVPLEYSICSWENRRHLRWQLVCNDVQIVHSFHGQPITTDPTENYEKVLEFLKAPTPACAGSAVPWWNNCSTERRSTLTWSSTLWMTNRDSSNKAYLSHWCMDQSLCSQALCCRRWRWRLFNRGTSVGRLLSSSTSNSVRFSVCFETIVLMNLQYIELSHCLALIFLHQVEQTPASFSLITRGRTAPSRLFLVSPSWLHDSMKNNLWR